VRLHEVGQDVALVEPHGAHPGEVVEADLVDYQPLRIHAQPARNRPLEADGDVAQSDGPMAVVEQRARHDPHRVREVDDPRSGRREIVRTSRDVEHHRDGAQGLGEPARAGRLLPDAPTAQRRGLVGQPRRLPAHADLHEDEVGALEGAIELTGEHEAPSERLAIEHPARQAADHLQTARVDVVQDQVVHAR
jgi:hypothetical protein